MLKIKTGSRIHITLIDMNGSLGRIDGSIGIYLKKPNIKASIKKTNNLDIKNSTAKEIYQKLSKKFNLDNKISINLDTYPNHIGLGSKTQISLAVGALINRYYNLNLDYIRLANILDRGGTSGIGTYGFKYGGFIFDAGHSFGKEKDKQDYLPSRFSKTKVAPLISHLNFPNWPITLVIPKLKEGLSGNLEKDFFKKNCPIPIDEVKQLIHLILSNLIPSILEKDLDLFSNTINKIQDIGFKKLEVKNSDKKIQNTINILREKNYGVGLSSFGPTFYVFAKEDEIKETVLEHIKADFLQTYASNEGAKFI